jgi:hypothetical protein
MYDEPVPVEPGEYESPGGRPEAAQRGMEAYAAEKDEPRFAGVLNGIELGDWARLDEVIREHCRGGGLSADLKEVSGLSYGYLPPGTAAWGPQVARYCENGDLSSVSQEFLVTNASFVIRYKAGKPFVAHDAPERRVAAASLDGNRAVVIRPITEEGFGRSWVAFLAGDGLIEVEGRDLPVEQTMKIAEAIKCDLCP